MLSARLQKNAFRLHDDSDGYGDDGYDNSDGYDDSDWLMIGDSDGYDDYDGYYDGSDRWRKDDEYGIGDLGFKRSMIGMMK